MKPGDVVDGRFAVEAIAGTGGMGTVYRARDLATKGTVALKVLRSETDDAIERFGREVRVLATLRHPGIVRALADGQAPGGARWLAMEWLEGENLAHRLAHAPLTANESVALARRVAEAVGVAHERGVVHRDLKPSNLFLADGDLERVKVLDFGIARITDGLHEATRTGVMVGTPGYMAPEQARGDRDVGPRADVFAVGCVLFECLTGRAAFVGGNIMAVLAKILLEDAPRLAELVPGLPDELDQLLARTLSKQADQRPRDGLELAAALAALGPVEVEAQERPRRESVAALTQTERRLLSVLLIASGEALEPTLSGTPGTPPITPADLSGVTPDPSAHAHTLPSFDPENQGLDPDILPALRAIATAHGANLERLVDGSYVAMIAGSGAATDQAVLAARCALALKARVPAAPMALATGRAVLAGRWPVGEAIDRAARLLGIARRAAPHRVRIDEVTAGLLDTRFDVGGDATGLYVRGARDVVEVARTLLGKQTPCVGRDRELGVLFGLFEECLGEPLARPVLVTGAAGIGKSRIRYELLRRVRERDQPIEVWIGRGDPLRAGSPFGMIAPALRRAAGILDGEPVEVRRQKLRARALRHAPAEVRHTTEFLGELVDAPFPDDESLELRAARQDPMVMGDHLKRAFEHFIATETAAQPLLIVLEDLHWGDLPTVKLIDSALQALPDRPWLVLALARPEVHELFPRLWADRGVQEIRLDELTRKGSERLIRRVLGEATADALVTKLIDRAHGNAFYLEELIRAVADGKQDAMPETVLAVVQGRLERVEGDARRVLRAASVFGQQFWRGGVTALLGGAAKQSATDAWLQELVARELIARSPTSRFPGEHEYLFRHALVREAAYEMLTDADRKLGHQLAGTWLERTGEGDATALAEHFERGGEPARAIEHYRRAVEQVLAAGDFRNVILRGDRGIACGAGGTLRGALRLAQAEAHKWCGEFADAARCGLEAMSYLPPDSLAWFAAASEAAQATGKLNEAAPLTEIGEALRAAHAPEGEGALRTCITAIAHAAFELYAHGNYPLAQELLDRIERDTRTTDDPSILARVYQARAYRAMYAGDAGALLEAEQAAAVAFERAGDLRYACLQRGYVGYACLAIGAYAEAEVALREALEAGTRLGLQNVVATAKHNLGKTLGLLGRLAEGLAVETEAIEAFCAQGDRRLECAGRLYRANIWVDLGDFEHAEAELRHAIELAHRTWVPQVKASLARVLLATDRAGAAFVAAREAHEDLEALGGVIEEGEALVRLMFAETLAATGERAAARRAASTARARLVGLAEKITDADWRRCFLEQVPEHARTMALERELAG